MHFPCVFQFFFTMSNSMYEIKTSLAKIVQISCKNCEYFVQWLSQSPLMKQFFSKAVVN